VTKAVLNSSVIIALSTLGYLDKLKHIFTAGRTLTFLWTMSTHEMGIFVTSCFQHV